MLVSKYTYLALFLLIFLYVYTFTNTMINNCIDMAMTCILKPKTRLPTNQKIFFFVYTARQTWGRLILTTSLVLLLFTFIIFSISIQELCTHEQEVHNSPILAHITSKCLSQGITCHHRTLCSNHKMFIVQSKDYQIELIASSFPH